MTYHCKLQYDTSFRIIIRAPNILSSPSKRPEAQRNTIGPHVASLCTILQMYYREFTFPDVG
jgi:hypothetical protein